MILTNADEVSTSQSPMARMKISLSELDARRFGAVTAKLVAVRGDRVDNIIDWCNRRRVELLIARCPTSEIGLVQEMETNGFYLTDTLVHYRTGKITRRAASEQQLYDFRTATIDDAEAIERIEQEM